MWKSLSKKGIVASVGFTLAGAWLYTPVVATDRAL